MSDADIAGQIVIALERAAAQAAARATELVSVNVEMLARAPVASVKAEVSRKTRSLVFVGADAFAADGERIASATSVHKIPNA